MANNSTTSRKRTAASQRPKFNPKSAPGDATGRAREAALHAQAEEQAARDSELTMVNRRAQVALDEAVDMQEEHERSVEQQLRLGHVPEEVIAQRIADIEYVEVVPIEDIECFIGPTQYHLKAGQTARIPLEHADQHFAGWLYPYL